MAGFHLKVSLDKMESKANEISGQITEIENEWKKLSSIIKKTKKYWKGDASELHQTYRDECETEMTELLKRLKEHPKDLLVMVGVYEKAEQEAVQLAQALPDDVIV